MKWLLSVYFLLRITTSVVDTIDTAVLQLHFKILTSSKMGFSSHEQLAVKKLSVVMVRETLEPTHSAGENMDPH